MSDLPSAADAGDDRDGLCDGVPDGRELPVEVEAGSGPVLRGHARVAVSPELFFEFQRTQDFLEREALESRAQYHAAVDAKERADACGSEPDRAIAAWWVKASFEAWHSLHVLRAEIARIEAKWHQENAMRMTLRSERMWNAELR